MLALMAELPDPVSARIQWLLAHTGRSKRAMSLASGLAASQVERLLVRGASGASLETLRKLADAAGCSLAWLVSGTGEPFDVEGQRPANDLPSRQHRLGDLDGYAQAEADARLLRPQYADHPVWQRMRDAEALTDGPVSGAALAELADYLIRHGWRRRT